MLLLNIGFNFSKFSVPLSSPSDQRFRALFGELFDIFDKKVDEVQEYRSTIHTLVKTLKNANNGKFLKI